MFYGWQFSIKKLVMGYYAQAAGDQSYGSGAGIYSTQTTAYIETYLNNNYHCETQYDYSNGDFYRKYSSSGYTSKSYYLPDQQIYSFSSNRDNPLDAYSYFSYHLVVNGQAGYVENQYHYNSGRVFGYDFANYTNYNSYQYGVGDYNRITYSIRAEGDYSEPNPGAQGVTPYSTYYMEAYFTPSSYQNPSYYNPG